MNCDTTECNPGDCKYDKNFQETASGKAFFDTRVCLEPFPSYIPADVPVKVGSFNQNMPFGFMPLSHAGNPHSGVHSINIATAMGWNDTQVERWTEPVQFMMSYAERVTVWEPMVPTEFLQGSESRTFSSPETPPLCQSHFGLPLTYNANYNADTGYTTFQLLGYSPTCACDNNVWSTPGALPEAACAAHKEEKAAYNEVFEKFCEGEQCDKPVEPEPDMFGKFSVAEVEAAFGVTEGSLILKGTDEFDALTDDNAWSPYVGIPIVLTSLEQIVPSPRNQFFQDTTSIGFPTFVYFKDRYFEQPLLGCFYRPKTAEINAALVEVGLEVCSDENASFAGVIVQYIVVGYVDKNTRLLFFGKEDDHLDDMQFLTQLVMAEMVEDVVLAENEIYHYSLKGPSAGEFAGFSDPESIQSTTWLGNHGHFEVGVRTVDLTGPCPDELCGNIVPGAIPNPLAPNAPWPEKVQENQCGWFACDDKLYETGGPCEDVDQKALFQYSQCPVSEPVMVTTPVAQPVAAPVAPPVAAPVAAPVALPVAQPAAPPVAATATIPAPSSGAGALSAIVSFMAMLSFALL